MPTISYEMQPEGTTALKPVLVGEVGDDVNIIVSGSPQLEDGEVMDVDINVLSPIGPEDTAEVLEMAAEGIRAALAAQS